MSHYFIHEGIKSLFTDLSNAYVPEFLPLDLAFSVVLFYSNVHFSNALLLSRIKMNNKR